MSIQKFEYSVQSVQKDKSENSEKNWNHKPNYLTLNLLYAAKLASH